MIDVRPTTRMNNVDEDNSTFKKTHTSMTQFCSLIRECRFKGRIGEDSSMHDQ